ncbi:uncharacterized protein QC763_500050 [Podospora pseudopauciseta]|uniref:C2H2-type domain-containing protein n=1 Tax=Podospora pseudopauciseta TaxID=2093780 RepID=A0ABR0H7R8_9PEZI|nr:hypothetical protein QC763_500050 [Podospora pseudopauciseta]
MTSHDIAHTSYEEQDYSVDPSLYQHEDTSYYTAGEASTSYAQPYSQEPDTTEASPTSSDPNKCSVCGKFFRRKCDLDKHMNNHTKRRQCPFVDCEGGGAETKDLHRHLWTHHPEYASAENIPKDEEWCGFQGCGYHGRRDNVKRHRDNHNHWPSA